MKLKWGFISSRTDLHKITLNTQHDRPNDDREEGEAEEVQDKQSYVCQTFDIGIGTNKSRCKVHAQRPSMFHAWCASL